MDEEEILKARIFGYAPIEKLRSFIDHVAAGQTDDFARIKLVSEEVFSIFSSNAGVAEALFEIDVDYSIGYLNKLGSACPSALKGAVDRFLRFSFSRLETPSIWKVCTPMLLSGGAVETAFFNSSVATRWFSSNRAFMEQWINGLGSEVLPKEKMEALKDKWSRLGSCFSS